MTAPSFNETLKANLPLTEFIRTLLEQQKIYAEALTGTSEARQRVNELFVDMNTKVVAGIFAFIGAMSVAVSFLMENGGVVANGSPKMWALILIWITAAVPVLASSLFRYVCCRFWLQKVKFYIARSKEQICIMSENEEHLARRMFLDEYERMKKLVGNPIGSCDASLVSARESDLALPRLFAAIYVWIAAGSVVLAALTAYML